MKFIILIVLLLSGCTDNSQLTKKQYYIFGTIVEVLIWHDNETQVNRALHEIELELNAMHSQWHAWKKGRLNEINTALRNGNSINITNEEKAFIQETISLSRLSYGYFNPAIGEIINTWGFHTDEYPILSSPPSPETINSFLINLPKMDDLVIVDNKLSSTNQSIWLDYGGVAKGLAIDNAIGILKTHGINDAIVNAGGDLRSIGAKGNKNWKVAIRKPNSSDILTSIDVIGDESIFTSGNYERYKEFDGKRYAHIISPLTGSGVDHIVSATVIAENGTKADAAATAIIVAGIEKWNDIIKNMEMEQAMIIDENGKCFATPKMKVRLSQKHFICNKP